MNISQNSRYVFSVFKSDKCVKGHTAMGNCGRGVSFLFRNICGGAM